MKHKILFILSVILINIGSAHAYKWAVYFKDKNNSNYSIDNPKEFLSLRAIERRQKFNIAITEEDFPVNSNYVQQIEALGATIFGTSRWLNCAIIEPSSVSIISTIEQLDFVEKTIQVTEDESYFPFKNKWDEISYEKISKEPSFTENEYGYGYEQINQINGIGLHNRGYTGQGVLISVIDGAFQDANNLDVFEHLRERNGIIFTRDVVHPGASVYESTAYHGTTVLSCMGSKLKDTMIGTAPDADFALIRTEDETSENLIEEYNLVIGLEVADSLGSDLVNISLGYSVHGNLNHTYEEMDGRQIVSSYAAYRAAEKGMFICNSAGNNRDLEEWPWINSPADTPEVTTVGAVDFDGYIAYFSSIGPNANGVPKPEVVAPGVNVAVVMPFNEYSQASGTSFSSPIFCGMVACLIQAFPPVPPQVLKQMIVDTASNYDNYEIDYGYGIPDFEKVFLNNSIISESATINIRISPNPAKDYLHISSEKNIDFIEIVDLAGRSIMKKAINSNKSQIDISGLNSGLYFIVFSSENRRSTEKFLVE